MWVIPRDVGIGLGSVWLIDRAYVGFGGMTGRVLTFLPLAYLGMISYGIYVTHNFVGGFVTRLFTILRIQQASSITRLSLLFLMTIAVASASWYILERPINGLKRYFPYRAHENP
jgi:peptidoglycan/LPS O-acetylase OafA/YrhL